MPSLKQRGDHLRAIVDPVGVVSRTNDEWQVSCRACKTRSGKRTLFRHERVSAVVVQWMEHEATALHARNVEMRGPFRPVTGYVNP